MTIDCLLFQSDSHIQLRKDGESSQIPPSRPPEVNDNHEWTNIVVGLLNKKSFE
jgi:hypothetical protein